MKKCVEEVVETITSTQMPNGDHPTFTLTVSKTQIWACFAWGNLAVVSDVSLPKDFDDDQGKDQIIDLVVLQTAERFAIEVGERMAHL